MEVLIVSHGASPNRKLCLCDLPDMCKKVLTPVHVMFKIRLLMCSARCIDELQELHRGRGLFLLAV